MSKFVILALLLVMASCALKKQAKHHSDTKTVLAELDKNIVGSTYISAVALNIAAKAPVEEISLLIDEILANLEEAQDRADEKNRTDDAICEETIGGFRKQIYEQEETVDSLTRAIRDNNEILEQANIDLTQANSDYDETVEAIDDGTEERETQHSAWSENDYEQSTQVATLEEGVKLIQHMIHGVAFSQIKARYQKVLDKLSEPNQKRATMFKPLISSLTQLATKLNYENVMKILDLLQSIRASILEDQTSARVAEEQDQSDWETLLSHLEAQKKSLSDKKSRLKNLIESTTALLQQLSESLENHTVELENLENSVGAQGVWCDIQSENYISDSAERAQETEVLTQIQDQLNDKYGAVEEYTNSREDEEDF